MPRTSLLSKRQSSDERPAHCWSRGHASAFYDNKVYIFGGSIAEASSGSENATNIFANPDLLTIDLTHSSSVSELADSIKKTVVPADKVSITSFGQLWPGPFLGSLLISQGELNKDQLVLSSDHNALVPSSKRADAPKGRRWVYSLEKGTWETRTQWKDYPTVERAGGVWAPRPNSQNKNRGFLIGGVAAAGSKQEGPRDKMLFFLNDGNGWQDDNNTLPPMEYPAVTFLPGVSEEGLVIAMGGFGLSEEGMPDKTIDYKSVRLYDIHNKKWYTQPTISPIGEYPTPRAHSCLVAVSAPDSSSHQLYLLGGTSGDSVLDDLWILSLPSFQWLRLPSAFPSGPISAHTCNVIGNDRYILTYGGDTSVREVINTEQECQKDGPIKLFDLVENKWTDEYKIDPSISGATEYRVPQRIYQLIGGNARGGATVREPEDGFTTEALAKLFHVDGLPASVRANSTLSEDLAADLKKDYDKATSGSSDVKSGPTDANEHGGSNSKISSGGAIAGIVIGAVAGLALLILVLWFVKKRRAQKGSAGPKAALLDGRQKPTELPYEERRTELPVRDETLKGYYQPRPEEATVPPSTTEATVVGISELGTGERETNGVVSEMEGDTVFFNAKR